MSYESYSFNEPLLKFSDFNRNSLFEGNLVRIKDWTGDITTRPEWEELQSLGFVDATTPGMMKNNSILLKNEKIPK
jgi:hypothetical protein